MCPSFFAFAATGPKGAYDREATGEEGGEVLVLFVQGVGSGGMRAHLDRQRGVRLLAFRFTT